MAIPNTDEWIDRDAAPLPINTTGAVVVNNANIVELAEPSQVTIAYSGAADAVLAARGLDLASAAWFVMFGATLGVIGAFGVTAAIGKGIIWILDRLAGLVL